MRFIGGINGTKGSGVTVAGKFGNALNFDGSTNANSVVDFGSNSRRGFNGVFSVSLWVKRDRWLQRLWSYDNQ